MKPCNAAAILFGLKFADTFTTSLREANLRKPDFRAPNVPAQNRIYRKMAIQGHALWDQWKGSNGLSNTKY